MGISAPLFPLWTGGCSGWLVLLLERYILNCSSPSCEKSMWVARGEGGYGVYNLSTQGIYIQLNPVTLTRNVWSTPCNSFTEYNQRQPRDFILVRISNGSHSNNIHRHTPPLQSILVVGQPSSHNTWHLALYGKFIYLHGLYCCGVMASKW